MNVVVIGAGLAGLVAAIRLREAGAEVSLLTKGIGGLQLSQGTVDVLGYSPDWNLADGAKQLHEVFEAIQLDAETFYGRGHTRLKQIDWLLKTGQVDEKLFWKKGH